MPAPHGTLIDVNTVQKQLGWLIRFIDRNSMLSAQTLSTLILSEFTTINTAIQGATSNVQLAVDPALALRFDINPDAIGPTDSATFTGGA